MTFNFLAITAVFTVLLLLLLTGNSIPSWNFFMNEGRLADISDIHNDNVFAPNVYAITIIPDFSLNYTYVLSVEGSDYNIPYMVDADVLAMAVDAESRSLLIGLDEAQDSVFLLQLSHDVVYAPGNQYTVLVDWVDTDYEIIYTDTVDYNYVVIQFFVPAGAVEVEVIGTTVAPEFSFGTILIFSIVMLGIIFFSKKYTSIFLSGRHLV